jgi:hypothetical protein
MLRKKSMNTTLTRQMIEQQQRDETVRTAFVKQHPELAEQVHTGSVDLARCRCPLCEHIRAAVASSVEHE